jgi:hypothetical protein
MPTKADLEAENTELRRELDRIATKERRWGNGALKLAADNDWCETVQDFLDQEGIPYDSPRVRAFVTVTYEIEGEISTPTDLTQDDQEQNKRFVRSCIKSDVFANIRYDDLMDNDFKYVTGVAVTEVEVTEVERMD